MPLTTDLAIERALRTVRAAAVCLLTAACFALSAQAADTIRLRNLEVVSGRTVTAFDEDGVRFDSGEPLTWDDIEKGTVAAEKQADFNRYLKELGEPLFQIRRRLKVADYEGLLAPAEAIYPKFAGRKSETAYMVTQGLMWARLASGKREAAVEPYLRCYEHLRAAKGKPLNLPGDRKLAFEAEAALSPELPPVWFDAKEAKEALPAVFEAVKQMADPRPEGARIYYATLALAAGETETGERVLAGVTGEKPSVAELKEIALAQQEIQAGQPGSAVSRLAARHESISAQNRPAALYWLGISQASSKEEATRREGVLHLLHLPALYGKTHPELAGAGLYEAMRTLGDLDDAKGSASVRKELLTRYAQTVHGARAKSEGEARKE